MQMRWKSHLATSNDSHTEGLGTLEEKDVEQIEGGIKYVIQGSWTLWSDRRLGNLSFVFQNSVSLCYDSRHFSLISSSGGTTKKNWFTTKVSMVRQPKLCLGLKCPTLFRYKVWNKIVVISSAVVRYSQRCCNIVTLAAEELLFVNLLMTY